MSIPKSGTYALSSGNLVKIGKSAQIAKRIRAIQCHSPAPVTLIGTSPDDIEADLHRELRDHHVYGEWFSLSAVIEVLLRRLDRQNVDVMSLVSATKGPAIANRMKTHCKRGHELSPENCAAYAAKRGYRVCAICVRENGREYKNKNRDKLNAQARDRRSWDPERLNAVERAWYAANLERVRARKREQARISRAQMTDDRRARLREQRARWRLANREKINKKHAQWAAENREAVAEYQRRYRERKNALRSDTRRSLG